ncbi:hypothetical protein P4S70_17055 [Enterovibrio sp. Hal110]
MVNWIFENRCMIEPHGKEGKAALQSAKQSPLELNAAYETAKPTR